MKKLYTPNRKLYEHYYVDQARQKGSNFMDPDFSRGMRFHFERAVSLGDASLQQQYSFVVYPHKRNAKQLC